MYDTSRVIYVALRTHTELKGSIVSKLLEHGFQRKHIAFVDKTLHANVGDYYAELLIDNSEVRLRVVKLEEIEPIPTGPELFDVKLVDKSEGAGIS